MALLLGRRFFAKALLRQQIRNHGYIVLVPEIGEDQSEKNPLVAEDGLPQFNNVTIENCMAAIGKQTLQFENDVLRIETAACEKKDVKVFEDVIDPLEKDGAMLNMTWGLSKMLYLGNSSLMPTKSYLAIHDRAKRARAAKYNSKVILRLSEDRLKEGNLDAERERVLQKYALEGRLNGLNLNVDLKAQLELSLNKLMVERVKFKTKIDAITKKFGFKVNDPQIMRDFPQHIADNMSADPTGVTGPWMVSLQPQISGPFLEFCPEREMRWNLWHGLVSRGSGYADKEYETSTHIEEIRFQRKDQARILGYNSFADMSMETKMAGNVNNVVDTIHYLLSHAKPAQDEEITNLHKFAVDRGFHDDKIELWDYAYWKRKQRKSLFNFDEETIQEYFPINKVLEGLFDLTESLFNVKIKQRSNISTWHKDVKFYDVFESHSSAPVAGFYFDPYARTDSQTLMRLNSGWMVGIQNHSRIAETKPLAALVFNFQPSTADKPSLLNFQDLQTLFHRFGQTLQHILSRTTYSEVSGLSNIEWDAVDVCGNVLTSWLLDKKTIESISSHYMSEDKLPTRLFEAMVNTHKHCAATDLCTELYYSVLDLELHSTKDFWLDIVKSMWSNYRSFKLHKTDSHVCSFAPIFSEEWAAAYYSRVWSKMIAADVYGAFLEAGDARPDVGKRFRDTFLALGGSRHPNEIFRNFRGRDPSPKALLTSLGLKKPKKE